MLSLIRLYDKQINPTLVDHWLENIQPMVKDAITTDTALTLNMVDTTSNSLSICLLSFESKISRVNNYKLKNLHNFPICEDCPNLVFTWDVFVLPWKQAHQDNPNNTMPPLFEF